MADLSVLIPARREMFLGRTVEDVLAHIQGDTEVIVVADGDLPDPPLPVHPRLTVALLPKAIGQRAACNYAARLSSARYVMKLDAHCAVSPGFDVALLETAAAYPDDVTWIPRQYNLHAFDWVCAACGRRTFQGPSRTACGLPDGVPEQVRKQELRQVGPGCGAVGTLRREIVWNAERRRTEAWRFDADLTFGYFGALKDRADRTARKARQPEPAVLETMSCLGACWLLTRERYWALGGMDEGHGSWGQMGTELACKSWLSGGRMLVNRRAWFSHMFRTQGGDFSFPYDFTEGERQDARAYSRRLWLQNAWPGQTRPLRWLVERFMPVPGWTPEQVAALPTTLDRKEAAA